MRLDEDERRQGFRAEQKNAVSKTGQSAGESSQQKSGEADGQRKATART